MTRRAARDALTGVACLLLALSCAATTATAGDLAAPAAADSAAPTGEQRRLADEMAAAFLDATLDRTIISLLADKMATTLSAKWPPEWKTALIEAAVTEAQVDRPRFQRPLSDLFAARLTEGELRAGVAYFTSPGARLLILRSARGDPDQPTQDEQAQIDQAAIQLRSTADGRSLAAKFGAIGQAVNDATLDAQRYYLPGLLKRFGERVEAETAKNEHPPTEADQLGGHIACTVLPQSLMIAKMKAAMSGGLHGAFAGVPSRPDWDELMSQAISEEIDSSAPALCRNLGRPLTQGLSNEEDRKILAFLASPSGLALRAMIADAAAGGSAKSPSAAVTRRIDLFLSSPIGRKFNAGMSALNMQTTDIGEAYAVSIVPGVIRRFGEKAVAEETASQQTIP